MVTIFLCLAFLFTCQAAFADPAALYFDPGATHGMYGVNRLPAKEEEWSFDLHLSPFYQHETGARDKDGNKVPLGDRTGHWKMLPILWGNMDAAPKEFTEANYATLYTLSLKGSDVGGGFSVDEDGYEGAQDTDGDWSVPGDYEKKGLRLELDVSMSHGFGLMIKTGIVDFRRTGTFLDLTTETGNTYVDAYFQDTLMTDTTRESLLETDLGLDLSNYDTVAFEDTFVQLFWSNRFELENSKGSHVVTVAPYFGAGVWIPTGKKKDQDKAFSMPTGHDGFWGFNLEAAVSLDFPKTVLFNFGGGITFFESKSQCLRVPNHKYQRTVFPFKVNARRTFGTSWNVNFSGLARNVYENFNVYFEYLYSKHENDTLTLTECDDTRAEAFVPKVYEEESLWKSHTAQLGFEYVVSPNLSVGACAQTHISGIRVFKTHTIMGNIKFTF
jgi:hypothetical protein